MTPYERVLKKIGGKQKTLVELSGRKQSTVSKWAVSGIISLKAAPTIIERANAKGYALHSDDFMPWSAA